MRISDWSSDVCSSDLRDHPLAVGNQVLLPHRQVDEARQDPVMIEAHGSTLRSGDAQPVLARAGKVSSSHNEMAESCRGPRSEEHTSELQSLMRISYAVFCLKNKNQPK